ncbi:hypothetical protein ACVWW2_001651 [Bradyrhizobium sp. LM4.3]
MKRFYLTAAVTAAALALPALPALAQTTEITIGITTTTTGPGAALGIPERNALEFVPKEIGGVPLKVIVLDDGGDPTTATTNARRFVTESKADIIMGSALTPPTIAVSNVANEAGIPHFGPRTVPDHTRAHEVVGGDAAADSDHGQGALPAYEVEGREDGRLYRLFRLLRRPLVQRLQGPGRADGHDPCRRRALCAARHLGDRTGAEARRRQSRRDPGRSLRHRGRTAADRAARARLSGSDLPDPRRGQHGFHPHRGQGRGRRADGFGPGDGPGRSAG